MGLHLHGIAPTKLDPHSIEPTGLHPHRIVPVRDCTRTGLHPHGVAPTELDPHSIEPTVLNPQDCTCMGLHLHGIANSVFSLSLIVSPSLSLYMYKYNTYIFPFFFLFLFTFYLFVVDSIPLYSNDWCLAFGPIHRYKYFNPSHKFGSREKYVLWDQPLHLTREEELWCSRQGCGSGPV